ncbi:hypothetical protein T492DRAFT_1098419, partial [Pavlovales sp. CCMP2436]
MGGMVGGAMGEMMGGMGAMGGGMAGGMGGAMEMDDFDVEEDTSSHMGENMIGEELDISRGTGECLKKLVKPGVGYDNPINPYEVHINYSARIKGEDGPFDVHYVSRPCIFTLHPEGEGCPVPVGVCKALRTFLKGETSILTLQPSVAFGEAGDPARGVPPNAVVEFEVTLLSYFKVETSPDGHISIKCIEDAKTWEVFEEHSEVFVAYELKLADGTVVMSADGSKASPPFVMGADAQNAAAGFPAFLAPVLQQVHLHSKYVVALAPEAAYGSAGDAALGVPPDAALTLELQVTDVYPVEELAAEGALTKKTLAKGDGWMTPSKGWEVFVHYTLSRPDGTQVRSTRSAEPLVFVCGGEALTGLPRVFEHVIAMKRYESAHFVASAEWSGEAEDGCTLDVELLKWVEVRAVRNTNERVRMKVFEQGVGYEHPNDGAKVEAKVTVRLASDGSTLESSDESLALTIDDDEVVPAIDMALKELSKGAVAELTMPAEWGYTPSLALTRGVPLSAVGQALVVSVELLAFERAKDEWVLDKDERRVIQQRKKEQGNRLFADGRFAQAAPKYEKSLSIVHDHEDKYDAESEWPEVNKLRVVCLLNKAM